MGLAGQSALRPPTVLVIGEGAISNQIHEDLQALGLDTVAVSELPISDVERQIPRVTDPNAGEKFQQIFRAFREWGEVRQQDHSWVHPGVSIWAERPEFEGWARKSGLSAVAAPAKSLTWFWNTLQLLKLGAEKGVPNLILSDEPVTSIREIEATLRSLVGQGKGGLPCILKSAYRVRGGYSSRRIQSIDDLNEWVPIWINQIQEHSGTSLLYVERYLESARYYTQPFVRLRNGDLHFFPVLDASLMFEGKNWVEVCPAQSLDSEIQLKIETYTRRILEATDFVGVGSLAFLSNGIEAYLIEALGRPNFAYRLWEKVGRCSAIQWQLQALAPALSGGAPLVRPRVGSDLDLCGVNLKFYAEDTWLKIPHPGWIHELSPAQEWNDGAFEGHLQWGVQPGIDLDWKKNGSLGHLTVFAPSWREAIDGLKKTLPQIWVSGGIQTNERFLLELMTHPWIAESMFYTGFVDEEFIPKQAPPTEWLQWISNALSEITPAMTDAESWIWMNAKLPAPTSVGLRWSQRVEFDSHGMSGVKGFFQTGQGSPERICVFPVTSNESGVQRYVVRLRNWFFSIRRSIKGRPLALMALASGRVHSIFYREGSKIEPRQTVLLIEAHQSLVPHRLPIPVRLSQLKVAPEDEVVLGQELALLERWSDN